MTSIDPRPRRRGRPGLRFEQLETRSLLSVAVFEVNLYEDAGGAPGPLIAADEVEVGETFFVEITARDLDPLVAGFQGVALDIAWDPQVMDVAEAAFDPASLITPNLPLLQSGALDRDAGTIDNLAGYASLSSNAGRPIGNLMPERFALLRFEALAPAADSPLSLSQGLSRIATLPVSSLSEAQIDFEPQTITVVAPGDPAQTEGGDTLAPGSLQVEASADVDDVESATDAGTLVGLQVNVYEDAGGVPGDLLVEEAIEVGDAFFVEITAEDLRDLPQGIGGLSVDVFWSAEVFEEIDQPFDPGDPNSALVSGDLPLYRSGSLDNAAGTIDELAGAALRSAGKGEPIGSEGPERFSLLRFRALAPAEDSAISLAVGDGGVGIVDGLVSDAADVLIDSYSLDVVEGQAPAEIAVATSGPEGGAIQFTTEVARDGTDPLVSPLVRPALPDTKQYVDVTNPGTSPLTVYEIQVHAPGVTVDTPLGSGSDDDLILAAGQTGRFRLKYAPTSPNPGQAATESFDVSDGLVILSNAESTPRVEVPLLGASTFDADITYDGRVNLADLTRFDDHFGRQASEPRYAPAIDPNGDGVVDMGDFGLLNVYYLARRTGAEPALLTASAPQAEAADLVFKDQGSGDASASSLSGEMENLLATLTSDWFEQDDDPA